MRKPKNATAPQTDKIVSAAPKTKKQVEKLTVELIKQNSIMTRQSVEKWRRAWKAAVDVFNPDRRQLLAIYNDTIVDMHYLGVKGQRVNGFMSQDFTLTDAKGKPTDKVLPLLNRAWFAEYRRLWLDHKFYGHSLIELGDLVLTDMGLEFKSVKLVKRQHVRQEWGIVVKNEGDNTGYPYREPPFDKWYIEIGNSEDLGLLLGISRQAISKRNAEAFWDEFTELFGMPIRIGKTSTRDRTELAKMENMLANMGSAAYGIFPAGTDIDIKETSKTDAFNVYDKRIERANSEMSKGILTVTMTADNGSSKSQSQTHQEMLEEALESDRNEFQAHVNEVLLPIMISHGYPFTGLKFSFTEEKSYTVEEEIKRDEFLLEHFDLKPEYFKQLSERYNAPIIGLKVDTTAAALDAGKKKILAQASSTITALYGHNCVRCGGKSTIKADGNPPDFSKFERIIGEAATQMLKDVFEGNTDLNKELIKAFAQAFVNAIFNGFSNTKPPVQFEYDAPDFEMLSALERNVYRFAGAKTYQELVFMNSLLTDGEGNVRSFQDFTDQVQSYAMVNRNHLRTEYAHAIASSQMASRWADAQRDKDLFPSLKYETVGDDRVRELHQALDGITKPVDDEFWDTWFPPNGWNCRCDVTATAGDDDTPDTKIPALPSIQDYFKRNVGKTLEVFPPEHPYFKDADSADIVSRYVYNEEKFNAISLNKDFNISGKYGFDKKTGGYIALHKEHQAGALASELPACNILRDNGYGVILMPENKNDGKEPDAIIDGFYFEIKSISKATNITNRVRKDITDSIKKGVKNIAIHDVKGISQQDFEEIFKRSIVTEPDMKRIIYVRDSKVYYFNAIDWQQKSQEIFN